MLGGSTGDFFQQLAQQRDQNVQIRNNRKFTEKQRSLISDKYKDGHHTVFDKMIQTLNDASLAYSIKLNENLLSKKGCTEELMRKVHKDGMSCDRTKFVKDIKTYRDKIADIDIIKVTSFHTISEADEAFDKVKKEYDDFFSNWKINTAKSLNHWSDYFDKLLIEENNPVANVAENVPNQNLVLLGDDDLLKQLQSLQQQLAQKDQLSAQKDQLSAQKDQLSAQKDLLLAQKDLQLAQKDRDIDKYKSFLDQMMDREKEQNIAVQDLREDKKELKEKVNEQKNKIDTLTKTNLEQFEKLNKVSDKYLDLKTHFVDLVNLHQEADSDYVPVVDLAGLNLDHLI